ncbi:MAG: hypothetical protein MRQ09_03025 [Candidatus Midichloria sp.]|nr:hypothetical protein [Candidatus Midichloria sp.]
MNSLALIDFAFIMIISFVGFIVRAKNPNIEPGMAFIHFINNYLSIGIKGIVIAGLLAIIMSTVDAWLNTTSTICTQDICWQVYSFN